MAEDLSGNRVLQRIEQMLWALRDDDARLVIRVSRQVVDVSIEGQNRRVTHYVSRLALQRSNVDLWSHAIDELFSKITAESHDDG